MMKRGVIYGGIILMLGVVAILMGSYYRKIGGVWPAFSPELFDATSWLGSSTSSRPSTLVELSQQTTEIPLKLPSGYAISVFATDLSGTRVLATDPKGTLLVSLASQGKVLALPDENADGRADEVVAILSGLRNPHGIALKCDGDTEVCDLYVAEEKVVSVFEYHPPTREAVRLKTLPLAGNEQGVGSLVTGWVTPKGALDRPTGLTMDADGTLYVVDDKSGVVYQVKYTGR